MWFLTIFLYIVLTLFLLEEEESAVAIPTPPASQEMEPSSTHVSPSSSPTPVSDPNSSGHSTVSFSDDCACMNYSCFICFLIVASEDQLCSYNCGHQLYSTN